MRSSFTGEPTIIACCPKAVVMVCFSCIFVVKPRISHLWSLALRLPCTKHIAVNWINLVTNDYYSSICANIFRPVSIGMTKIHTDENKYEKITKNHLWKQNRERTRAKTKKDREKKAVPVLSLHFLCLFDTLGVFFHLGWCVFRPFYRFAAFKCSFVCAVVFFSAKAQKAFVWAVIWVCVLHTAVWLSVVHLCQSSGPCVPLFRLFLTFSSVQINWTSSKQEPKWTHLNTKTKCVKCIQNSGKIHILLVWFEASKLNNTHQ